MIEDKALNKETKQEIYKGYLSAREFLNCDDRAFLDEAIIRYTITGEVQINQLANGYVKAIFELVKGWFDLEFGIDKKGGSNG